MKLEATLIEAVSKKSGEPYKCVEIQLTPTYKTRVFLSQAEMELLNNLSKNQNSNK